MLVTGFGGLAQNTGNTVSTLVIGFSQVSTALSPVIGTLVSGRPGSCWPRNWSAP